MTTLPEFLLAIVITHALAFGGHYYWVCQYGANFTPTAILDNSQVIKGDWYGLLAA